MNPNLGQWHASSDAGRKTLTGQNQIVPSENYCFSSITVVSIDEIKKKQSTKDYNDDDIYIYIYIYIKMKCSENYFLFRI